MNQEFKASPAPNTLLVFVFVLIMFQETHELPITWGDIWLYVVGLFTIDQIIRALVRKFG